MKRRAVALCCLCIACVLWTESAAITLGGQIVPKEKMFVFLLIGNSAMSGRDPHPDTAIVPNTWNFRLPNPGFAKDTIKDFFKWAPAKSPLCRDERSSGCQDPGTPFVQSLAKYYASHGRSYFHFGILQHSGANWQMTFLQRGRIYYDSIINPAKRLKDSVTIAGVVSMLSIVEGLSGGTAVTSYVANTLKTVSQIREDLGMPNLPYLHSCYPVMAQGDYDTTHATVKSLMAVEPNVPKSVTNCVLIHTNGLSVYLGDGFMSHFDTAGCKAWGKRVADSVIAHNWISCPTCDPSIIPLASGKIQHSAVRAQPQRIYFDGHSLPPVLSAMPHRAVVCALSGRTVAKVDQITQASCLAAMKGLAPGMYVIEPVLSGR